MVAEAVGGCCGWSDMVVLTTTTTCDDFGVCQYDEGMNVL